MHMIVCVYNIPLEHSLTVGSFFQTTMKPTVVSIRNRHPVTKNETCSYKDTFLYVYLCGICMFFWRLATWASKVRGGHQRRSHHLRRHCWGPGRRWDAAPIFAEHRVLASHGLRHGVTWLYHGKPMENPCKTVENSIKKTWYMMLYVVRPARNNHLWGWIWPSICGNIGDEL